MVAAVTSLPSDSEPSPTERSDAPFGATLALTVTLSIGAFAGLMALALLIVHPSGEFSLFAGLVNQQNQSAKTALYVLSFLVLLPGALVAVPRLCDSVADGPNGSGLGVLAGLIAGGLAATLIVVRVSGSLPWGDGLGAVLGGTVLWGSVTGGVLYRARQRRPWELLLRLTEHQSSVVMTAGVLVFGGLLGLTKVGSLNVPALLIAAVIALVILRLAGRAPRARLGYRSGRWVDALIALLIGLAVPDLIIFHASPVPPNLFFVPGIVQSQHDFFLGPTNQLLAGGTLLVNSPGSQYGVGSLYFLAAWFHLVPIGYGTFGLLDGILSALFYAAAYLVLRLAGVSRSWAAGAMALAVVVLVYHFAYRVGVLPEQGPLRFGLPMLVLVGVVIAARSPRHRRAGSGLALAALGISAIWAVETFGFTLITFAAATAMEAWVAPRGTRSRWARRRAALGVLACVTAHGLFALGTLAGSGHLPDWGQYWAYIQSFLLGGAAGQVTYGFADWSPGLALGAASFASVAAIVLLARRRPELVAEHRTLLIALAGGAGYSVALLSYIDSRSSTYVLPYVALPTLLCAVLWLRLLSAAVQPGGRSRIYPASLAFALAVAVILVAAAWPTASGRLSGSALAHALPGGGMRSAIDRLLHPPAIDPRTPAGVQLLNRQIPGRRALVLLADSPDLATEILMHAKRADLLSVGDPGMDSYVPSNWTGPIGSQVAALAPGTRLLTDTSTLGLDARLRRARPAIDPLRHPLVLGGTQIEWILEAINRRFSVRPIERTAAGLTLAELVPR